MQESRLFRIVYYLLKNGHTTAQELAKELEVSIRTIYRDVDALSISGIPIFCTQGKGGGITLLDRYIFDKGMVSEREQQSIITALQSLNEITEEVDNDLILKLSGLFKQNNPNWLQIDFSRWGNKNADTRKFNTIKATILNRQVLTFRYVSNYGEDNLRRVKPIRICYKSKGWYLQAYCMDKNDFRTYKINRMLELRASNELFNDFFTPPPLEDFKKENDYPTIKMKFKKSSAYRVYDEFDESDIKLLENGDIIVECNLPDDDWLYGYLFSFCGTVEVLEPEHIRKSFIDILESVYIHYKSVNKGEVGLSE